MYKLEAKERLVGAVSFLWFSFLKNFSDRYMCTSELKSRIWSFGTLLLWNSAILFQENNVPFFMLLPGSQKPGYLVQKFSARFVQAYGFSAVFTAKYLIQLIKK